jgi:hypothetical protein
LLNPDWRLGWDVKPAKKSLFKVELQASFIKDYFYTLARPVNDRGFYYKFAKRTLDSQQQVRVGFQHAHQHLDWAMALEEPLIELYRQDKIDIDTIGLAVTLRAGISRYRNSPPSTKERFLVTQGENLGIDFMELYGRIAARGAIQRSFRSGTKIGVIDAMTEFVGTHSDPVAALLEHVGFTPPDGFRGESWESLVGSVRFGIVFLPVLRQAIFHTFWWRCFSDGEQARLTVQFERDEARRVLKVEVQNPGLEPEGVSKDKNELRDLSVQILGSDKTFGPEYIGGNCWSTWFSIDLPE